MKDMFYNYDNNIDKKEHTPSILHFDDSKILESDSDLQLVVDAKGNEVGVCAKHGTEFSLFFALDGDVECSSIFELVYNSTINFKVIDHWHNVKIDKNFTYDDAYLYDDVLKITLNQDEVAKLNQETYNMSLSLYWPNGSYELFSEEDGFLTIR